MKPHPRLQFCLFALLDLIEDMAFLASRPGLGRMSRHWGYTELRDAYRAFQRWESQDYFESVRRGTEVAYRITVKGRELLAHRRPSAHLRHRQWDGQWRMVVFDFPETARKGRDAFRWMLRQQRLGCLQKSVWISPDPIISEWKRILKEADLTNWVLLFESAELGPVDDVEIARRVWSLDELDADYGMHVTEFGDLPRALRRARAGELDGELGRFVRREWEAYFNLLQSDPLLPSALLPPKFAGLAADALHESIREALRSAVFEAKP